MTYVMCVLFVWDVHDCKETDGSFNSDHGMWLLWLWVHYSNTDLFYKFFLKGEGSEIALHQLIKNYQEQ